MREVVTPLDAVRVLEDAGVRVLRLDPPPAEDDFEADLLVPRAQRRFALEALGEADWRFEVGNAGLWRLTRRASYGWDGGLAVHLHWGVPAAPLPSRVLGRLERMVWERAEPGEGGVLRPDAPTQLALVAVLAARPGARRARWSKAAADAASRVDDWDDAVRVADLAGVGGSVRRTLARMGRTGVPGGRDSLPDRGWILAGRVERRVRSRQLRALLGGSPLLGRSVRRCRFAGIEVLAGPGVFRPMAVTEHVVEAALAALPPGAAATMLEAGTGCGAVSLAVAAVRPEAEIYAADISAAALRWARRNQRALGTKVSFRRGSLLEPFSAAFGQATVVAGNVPYIPPARAQAASEDTPGAVLGEGEDGLGLVRALSADALRLLRPDGRLVLQMLETQWEMFAGELERVGYRPDGLVGRRGPHVVVTATLR
jgi:methylase of polypeptide subunit release factors